jgi:gliding motility-associated-like protein
MSLLPLISLAQLSAPGMSTVRYTTGVNDPVFIFCNASGSQKGALNAISPGGTDPFTYSWYKWSDATKDFSIPFPPGSGDTPSSRTDLDEGGYQVRISDGGGYDTNLVAWIFLDKPYAEAKLQNFTCDYVALSGKAAIDTFYYRNLSNGSAVKLPNAYSFTWSSNPVSAIPDPTIDLNPVTYSPPLEDVTYKLQVVDSFLCTSESYFPYTSIHVKADFSVDPNKGDAPLNVSITDKSVRGYTYIWEFGDHSVDSISYLKDPQPHTYYRPGDYYITLTIESDKGCVGTLQSEKIVVDPSELNIPNVFTPDGDGINDFFMVESKSLRYINVEIYSRSGLMVYNFTGEGERLKEWQGWDGNVNKSSIKASPGVYFYIIRAIGWEDKLYDNKETRGFFYLYR